MALRSKSLILYGFKITSLNQNIDFKADSGGPVLTAVLDTGVYSLTTLLSAIALAMQDADTTTGSLYTATADRSIMGGTQNRVTIASTGSFLSLLFASGPNAGLNLAPVIGFAATDRTGSTSYTGTMTTGTALIPDFIGYDFSGPDQQAKLFGVANVAASGLKEAVTFAKQYFIDVAFKYEPASKLAEWALFRDWAISQAPFDFMPEIMAPSTVYPVTFEYTEYDNKGMGFRMAEMLSDDLPNFYETGALNLRVVLDFRATVYIA